MSDQDGLVFALSRSAKGPWRRIGWEDVKTSKPDQGLTWLHLDRTDPATRRFLAEAAGLDPVIAEALLEEETRPRAFASGQALFLILRGVNLNPGADPDDMVSIRLWIEQHRIISLRHRKVMAVDSLRQQIEDGAGPRTSADVLVELMAGLIERMGPVIGDLDDQSDDLEDRVVSGEQAEIRAELAGIRQQAIRLRRYLAPQREAMARLSSEAISWIEDKHKARLRETYDRVTRYVEELDSVRERAAVIQDQVANLVSEQINRNMYLLSIVATILLPLGVVTGLLGINVDGLPGSKDAPWAFTTVSIILVVMVAVEVVILRWRRWV